MPPFAASEAELLILGSSVRAAAQSARRAGYRVHAIDEFADQDLAAIGSVTQSMRYPYDLAELAGQIPPCPFLYTGALENHPEIVERIALTRPLLGNHPASLRAVRSPAGLAAVLSEHSLATPEISFGRPLSAEPNWLRKPLRSGGGRGIETVGPGTIASGGRGKDSYYWQRYIEGVPASAIFVAAPSGLRMLGVTKQLIGCDWAGATGFGYVGNVAPLLLPADLERQIERVGAVVAQHFQLVGLFGIDFIAENSHVWTIEVNPRYTSSIEVLERAYGIKAIRFHVDAYVDGHLPELPAEPTRAASPIEFHGKAVVYARATTRCGPQLRRWIADRNQDSFWPSVADIPAEGTQIQAGHPVCTVFADGRCVDEVELSLQATAGQLHAILVE